MQNNCNSARNCGPNMLLKPCTCSSACGKQEAFSICDLRTDSVEEMEGDGVAPQEHKFTLLALSRDKDVVCKSSGDAADR